MGQNLRSVDPSKLPSGRDQDIMAIHPYKGTKLMNKSSYKLADWLRSGFVNLTKDPRPSDPTILS